MRNLWKLIEKRELESVRLIKHVNAFLHKRRGYIFKLPPPGSPVIHLFSGGMDSVVVCDMLLRKYKLQVYPVFLRRGQRRVNREESAVNFFSKYFHKNFPRIFHEPQRMNAYIPPREIRWPITKVSNEKVSFHTSQWRGIPVYTSLLVSYAVQYAYFLEITRNVVARTIFCSFITSDGEVMAYETLTALRQMMLSVVVQTNETGWQVTSLPLEMELGNFWSKDTLVNWAMVNNLAIEKTWSCYWGGLWHCGKCIGCINRKEAFDRSGVKDKTKYWNELSLKPLRIYKYFFQ